MVIFIFFSALLGYNYFIDNDNQLFAWTIFREKLILLTLGLINGLLRQYYYFNTLKY